MPGAFGFPCSVERGRLIWRLFGAGAPGALVCWEELKPAQMVPGGWYPGRCRQLGGRHAAPPYYSFLVCITRERLEFLRESLGSDAGVSLSLQWV